MSASAETRTRFNCFGSRCGVLVNGEGEQGSSVAAVAGARDALLEWHERFSRFRPSSELSRLNRDRRETVACSPLMARLAYAVREAGELTGGLVDATLLGPLETAGYDGELGEPPALAELLALAPEARPAAPLRERRWQAIEVSFETLTITRPRGVMIDSGGLAKGLFADVLAEMLATHASFAVDCGGDLAIGGRARLRRPVHVSSPFDGSTLHTFELSHAGIATSGIGRRSWIGSDGRPAHHLLDPSSGRPAFTGIVQATALAPSALLAEIRAKGALLSGPRRARRWLPEGGVIVLADGTHRVLDPRPRVTLRESEGALRRARPAARAAQFRPAQITLAA